MLVTQLWSDWAPLLIWLGATCLFFAYLTVQAYTHRSAAKDLPPTAAQQQPSLDVPIEPVQPEISQRRVA